MPVYNLTNITDSFTIEDLIVNTNTFAGGSPVLMIYFGLLIVALFTAGSPFKKAFPAAAFLAFVSGTYLVLAGLISPYVWWGSMLLTGIGIILLLRNPLSAN